VARVRDGRATTQYPRCIRAGLGEASPSEARRVPAAGRHSGGSGWREGRAAGREGRRSHGAERACPAVGDVPVRRDLGSGRPESCSRSAGTIGEAVQARATVAAGGRRGDARSPAGSGSGARCRASECSCVRRPAAGRDAGSPLVRRWGANGLGRASGCWFDDQEHEDGGHPLSAALGIVGGGPRSVEACIAQSWRVGLPDFARDRVDGLRLAQLAKPRLSAGR
jgi:hypothetical protein